MDHFDVVVVGAGISGIGAAYNLKKSCPQKSYTILEGRSNLGGTWDLFKYPGIRSDSDMHTMGFKFKPWRSPKTIADAPSILSYLNETVDENDLRKKIQFNKKVVAASWSSVEALWNLIIEDQTNKEMQESTCNILYLCGGYYNYDEGYTPEFKNVEAFEGLVIHPQKWPENLDYTDKEVVVIGSGATAVTIIPSMADKVKHITMLQRSPTYYFAAPDEDVIGNFIKKFTTDRLGYFLVRWKNILLGRFMLNRLRKNPEKTKEQLIDQVREHLGEDYDVDKHFTPRYMPWDQRLCLVPNGDIFQAINNGKASVVTDTIDEFTSKGIKLDSGEELEEVKTEGKAPTYGSSTLKSNNEQGKKEAGVYEFKHTTTKTPGDNRSGAKGGSYEGTPSGSIPKRKDAKVIRSFSPMVQSFKEELIALKERQAIGKRRQLFR